MKTPSATSILCNIVTLPFNFYWQCCTKFKEPRSNSKDQILMVKKKEWAKERNQKPLAWKVSSISKEGNRSGTIRTWAKRKEKTETWSTWWRKKNKLRTEPPTAIVGISMRSWENKKDRNWGEDQEAPGEEIRISWQEKPTTPVSPTRRETHDTSFQIKREQTLEVWAEWRSLHKQRRRRQSIRLVLSLWFRILQKLKDRMLAIWCNVKLWHSFQF